MALFTDPLDPRANSYVTLAEANRILASRPYVSAWLALSQTPDAIDYVADGVTAIGQTTVPIKNGTGDFGDATEVQFGTDGTFYTLQQAEAAPATSLLILPALVLATVDNQAVYRTTPNAAESYLIWATQTLDEQMDWYGTATTACASPGPGQFLRWPRNGVTDLDGCLYDQNAFPELLKCATAEMALELAKRDLSATPGVLGQGFSKAEIPGPLKIEVDSSEIITMFSNYVLNKLKPLGELYDTVPGQGMRAVPLARA